MTKLTYSLIFILFLSVNSFDIRNGISRPYYRKIEFLDSKFNLLGKRDSADFEEKFAKLKIDHFSFDNEDTFNLRYLIKDKYFDKNITSSPILFYCGNEADIEMFWNNLGFITETLAKEFKGLVIFAEHRFFGKSIPFGAQDYDIKKNKYLTVEQAMSDFAEFLQSFKEENKMTSHPVIALGGSYGGMLAAWSRMKFPHVYKGAIASSAPILLFEDIDKISRNGLQISNLSA